MQSILDNLILTFAGLPQFALIIAALLAWPISFLILRRYRASVNKTMTQQSEGVFSDLQDDSFQNNSFIKDEGFQSMSSLSTDRLFSIIIKRPWSITYLNLIAGSAYSLILTLFCFWSGKFEFYSIRFAFLFLSYLWPVVFALNMVIPGKTKFKFSLLSFYFLIYLSICFIAAQTNLAFTIKQGLLLWELSNLLPTLLVLIFFKSKVRAIGSLVYTLIAVASSGSTTVLNYVLKSNSMMLTTINIGSAFHLGFYSSFIALFILLMVFFGFAGWYILIVIKNRYKAKKINDQKIMLDSIWILFAIYYSIDFAAQGYVWLIGGFLSFFLCKLIVTTGHKILNKKYQLKESSNLLFLRVFSLGKRSEQFFNLVSKHWRFAGSIQLISGPDLATTNLEPHEFTDYITGKLSRRFIGNPKDLEIRLSEMDNKPDRDGQYRVNDFFCYQNTWQMVLQKLVNKSNVVLMDLRGFSTANKGCEYEIRELFNIIPADRIVFIYDQTSDQVFMNQILKQAWDEMKPASLNKQSDFDSISMFKLTDLSYKNIRALLKLLCDAATDDTSLKSQLI
ncbi:MAG: hypothetical protein ABI723_16725 [Bacteroidia bacterium]